MGKFTKGSRNDIDNGRQNELEKCIKLERDFTDKSRSDIDTEKQNNIKSSNVGIEIRNNVVFYYLNVNSNYLKIVDVPGDGDRFYHSVLQINDLSKKF